MSDWDETTRGTTSLMPKTVVVGEAVAGQSQALRKKLLSLSQNIKQENFDLAELLLQVKDNRLYRTWGYESLGEYSETELGIRERKSRYLCRILEVCRTVFVPREEYEPIGVTKLREITTLDPEGYFFNPETKENERMSMHILNLLKKAKDMKASDIEEEVKRLKGQTGDDEQVIRSFSVTRACWENVIKPALELARQRLGSKGRDDEGKAVEYSDGAAYECICAEFLADPNNMPEPVEIPIEDEPIMSGDIPLEV